MTGDNIQSELDRDPFIPFRLHLVSGHSLDVTRAGGASMLQHAIMVFQDKPRQDDEEVGYDVIALRNIERLEQLR